MQARRPRPQSRNGHLDDLRRTSGESTASRESSLAPGSQYEGDPRIVLSRPQSQLSHVSQAHYATAPFGPYQQVEGPMSMPPSFHPYATAPGAPMDPAMSFHHTQYVQVPGDQVNGYYGGVEHYHEPTPFGAMGYPARTGTPHLPSGPEMDKKDKKNATTTAANEKELRELLEKNEGKSLDDIARDVRQAERTQKSERAKQLFAMRWYINIIFFDIVLY